MNHPVSELDPIRRLWKQLYPQDFTILPSLEEELQKAKRHLPSQVVPADWYTFGPLYCVYPDAFPGGFRGLKHKLPDLKDLGVEILWLLPCLESPGRDQGFDISDYRNPDPRYGTPADFDDLLETCHSLGMRLVFDVAVNHTSDQHAWFREARSDRGSPFRDYYIWSSHDRGFDKTDLIFKGMVNSNWTWDEVSGQFYFHRFYPFQPDLNYRNPEVTLAMIRNLIFWKLKGVDGFRMDAAPCMWKEEGTDCINRPQVHLLLKLFRASLDFLSPQTLFLAEANIPADQLLDFFAQGDECQSAYHFPLMPRFFQAFMEGHPERLVSAPFPSLPQGSTWITFLRLHDEVTLDLVTSSERPQLVEEYAPLPELRFRDGQAFSGRLFNLMKADPDKVLAAYSALFSLPGTPLIYYGDEIAMENNEMFYHQAKEKTGYPDSRFFHRGPYDLARWKSARKEPLSPEGKVLQGLKEMLKFRQNHRNVFIQPPELKSRGPLLISTRKADGKTLRITTNLSDRETDGIKPYGRIWEVL